MMKKWLSILLVAFVIPCLSIAGDANTGKQLFFDFACYTCHGYGGTGMTPLSPETSGVLSSEALFLTYLRLRADQNPVNPSRSMPNYSRATLSDEQAIDIYAYLITLRDDAPELKDIPVLQQIIDDAERRTNSESADK